MNDMVDTTSGRQAEAISAGAAVSEEDINTAVRSTAMLADVTISMWGAERTDRDVMEKIKSDAGATGNVGRMMKNLLAGADGLHKECKGAFAAVRTRHYGLTLPWVADPHATRATGPRLLPNMLFERYLGEMSTARRAANQALDVFLDDYPDAINRARANLGALADVTYPDDVEVRAQFKVAFDFEPIPAGQSFKGLPEHFLDKLSSGLRRKQDRMIAAASEAMWREVRERVGHMMERLAQPDAMFKANTVENVRELLTLLPAWNVMGSANIDEIVADISDMLVGIDVKDLRKDQRVRGDVARQAAGVVDKLTSWGL